MRVALDIDQLKQIPIDEVGGALGLNWSKSATVRCPLPDHDDKHPSFSIHRAKNLWHCFGCGRGGSVIDLVMAVRAISFAEACSWLANVAGAPEALLKSP